MHVKDFFRLVIKVFFLFLLIQIAFLMVPRVIINSLFSGDLFYGGLGAAILFIIIYAVYNIFQNKTDYIIHKLKLDQGFQSDKIEIVNFNSSIVISIALIIIGGLNILEYLPSFLHHIYTIIIFKGEEHDLLGIINEHVKPDYFKFGISIMNIILGFILIYFHKKLANLIDNMSKTIESDIEDETS